MGKLGKFLDLIRVILPAILSVANPALAPLSGVIIHGIDEAEQMKGATGAQKLAHVVNLSTLSAEGINTAAGKVIVDPTMVAQAAGSAISTAVDVANIIQRNVPVATAQGDGAGH